MGRGVWAQGQARAGLTALSVCPPSLSPFLGCPHSPGKGAENGACVYVCVSSRPCMCTHVHRTPLFKTPSEKNNGRELSILNTEGLSSFTEPFRTDESYSPPCSKNGSQTLRTN